MSNSLIRRLRAAAEDEGYILFDLAADRIEALESVMKRSRNWIEYYNLGDEPMELQRLLSDIDALLEKH